MASTAQHLKLENRILVCREYAGLWQTYFQFLSMEDIEERQITREMEQEFQGVMNVLALNHYKFSELCGEYTKESESIVKIMSDTPTLEAVKTMQESTRGKILLEWHVAFIDMNKAVGKMVAALPPKRLAAFQATEGDPQAPPVPQS